MIAARDALRLPAARLTADEARAADVLEQAVENHLLAHLSRAGCEQPFETDEQRSPVLAEVTRRLKKAGWIPQWQLVVEKNKFASHQVFRAWRLAGLGPTDAAYDAADDLGASA